MVVTIILYKKQSLILGYPIVNNSTYTFIVYYRRHEITRVAVANQSVSEGKGDL